jgi:threonine dehydrogenase-like Zn-dependent dehydrogenase
MRAVRIEEPGTVRLVEMPRPQPTDDEIVVRVRWAAVCGTDRKVVRRGVPEARVPGHEVAGELPDGTPVAVHPDIGCDVCSLCSAGWSNRCRRRQSVGIDRDGGFAEWMVVPPRQVLPVDGLPLELAALLEPLACCVHAVDMLHTARLRTAAVVGAGAMGVLAMWTLQANGVRVVVSQRSEERRRMAERLGADAVIGPDDDLTEAVGAPVDAVIVTAPGIEPLRWALDHVAVGGIVHAFAGTPGGADVDVNVVHYRHLRLVGSTGSTLADLRLARDMVRDGHVDIARLPRMTVGLENLPRVLASEPERSHLRTLVDVGGSRP